MEQRTSEWHRARLGIPTASRFEKIITPSGAPSSQAQSYLCRLICERLFDRSFEDHVDTKWMKHGRDTEDEAALEFERIANLKVERVGFVTTADGRWGCSPDRLVIGKNVAVEIKCPSPWQHMEYLVYGPGKDYRPQVQGQMLVGGYDSVCFFSYFPGMPTVLKETGRDKKFIEDLELALNVFSRQLDKKTDEMMAREMDYEKALSVICRLMPERED